MRRYLLPIFIPTFTIIIFAFSFNTESPSVLVKKRYLLQAEAFAGEVKNLQTAAERGDEHEMQTIFLKARVAYKKIEVFAEYFHPAYASKINGPAILYYEDAEPEKGAQAPQGLQLIESYLFPKIDKLAIKNVEQAIDELARLATEMPKVTVSEAFNDANIFDAVMEQVYRITALGIVGFDATLSGNSLPECKTNLQALQEIIFDYDKSLDKVMPGSYEKLNSILEKAIVSLNQNKSFNSFDRMDFTLKYLNPLASIIGEYKTRNGYQDNKGGMYYSAITKNNTLFSPLAFNPYKYIDDFSSTTYKIQLGRKLFFDKRLSSNKKRSCASCHQPGRAFTDGLKTSMALDGHTSLSRNAPTILNVALQRNLFADARSRTLEGQVMEVLNNVNEMHGSAEATAFSIISLPEYKQDYIQAYPNAVQADAALNVCNAIASYERRLIALNSRFDQHMRGEKILTQNEINGYNVFMGKGKCGTCHFSPLFNGSKPPRYYITETEVLGVPETSVKKNAKLSSDSGRYLITKLPMHLYAFKTPGLRNVALTAPYMHNGVFNTLEDVIEFYNNGGGKGLGIAPDNQTLPFNKLNLTHKEKKNLVLFMRSLTDTVTHIESL